MVVPQEHGSQPGLCTIAITLCVSPHPPSRVANAVGGFVTRRAIIHTGQLNTKTILPLIRQKPGPTGKE